MKKFILSGAVVCFLAGLTATTFANDACTTFNKIKVGDSYRASFFLPMFDDQYRASNIPLKVTTVTNDHQVSFTLTTNTVEAQVTPGQWKTEAHKVEYTISNVKCSDDGKLSGKMKTNLSGEFSLASTANISVASNGHISFYFKGNDLVPTTLVVQ